jgi:hypothetical protein
MQYEKAWNNKLLKMLPFPYDLFVNSLRVGDIAEFF